MIRFFLVFKDHDVTSGEKNLLHNPRSVEDKRQFPTVFGNLNRHISTSYLCFKHQLIRIFIH